jgi:hypothetical protein
MVRKTLTFDIYYSFIPKGISIQQAFHLSRYKEGYLVAEWKELENWTGTRSIHSLVNLVQDDGSWKVMEDLSQQFRSSRQVGVSQAQELLRFLNRSKKFIEELIEKALKWAWHEEDKIWSGWFHSVKVWQGFMKQAEPNFHEWNRRWGGVDSLTDWLKRWRKLWTSLCHLRARLMVWRVLQEGFYNNVRGHIWKKCNKRCPLCKRGEETTKNFMKKSNVCKSKPAFALN